MLECGFETRAVVRTGPPLPIGAGWVSKAVSTCFKGDGFAFFGLVWRVDGGGGGGCDELVVVRLRKSEARGYVTPVLWSLQVRRRLEEGGGEVDAFGSGVASGSVTVLVLAEARVVDSSAYNGGRIDSMTPATVTEVSEEVAVEVFDSGLHSRFSLSNLSIVF